MRVYTSFKNILKYVYNCRLRTRRGNLVHTFSRHYHSGYRYAGAASVNTSVLLLSLIRIICNSLRGTPQSSHLAAGVGNPTRPPNRPPRLSGALGFPGLLALTQKSWSWPQRHWHCAVAPD